MHPETDSSHNVAILKPDRGFRAWWMLLRPHTLTAAFVPVIVGTLLALKEGSLDIILFLTMLIASLLIQTATNLFNEYFDYQRGLDTAESVGIGGAIVRNGFKPQTILNLAIICIFLSILLGIYICIHSSWWLAFIGSICIAIGYLYTGGPYPISYTPLGELVSGVFMGVIIILISFFIQTGYITSTAVLHSIPIAITIGAINLANNIRDLDGDKKNGRKTLAILLGREKAIQFLGLMFTISYTLIFLLVVLDYSTWWALLAFLSIPKAIQAVKRFSGKTKPIEMMPAMKATSQTNTFLGLLLAAGILISYFVS